MLKTLYKNLADFVFPRHCINCNKLNPVSNYEYICNDCAKSIFEENQTRCLRCGEFVYFKEDLVSCPKCHDTKFYFSENFSCVSYKGINAKLVKELKYNKALYLLKDIAKIITAPEKFQKYIENAYFVAVPLHKSREKKRSFNQSLEIAKSISAITKTPVLKDLLLKIKDTPTQTHLDKEMRMANIKNAFCLNPIYADLDKDTKLIIIDDVMTTGATLNECAKTLHKHKFKDIGTLSFAKRPFML